MRRVWLAPLFGIAIASSYAIAWFALDRAFTARTLLALGFIAAAGALSAAAVLVATHLLASRPWTARFAAALFCLTAGAVGLTSLFLAIEVAWASHPPAELPLHIVLLIVANIGLAALYNFLALAGFLFLPLGLAFIAAFAWAIAWPPR